MMDLSKEAMPSSNTLLEWAQFLGVSPSTARLDHIIPQVRHLLDDFNRLEGVDLTGIEPSIIFLVKRAFKDKDY